MDNHAEEELLQEADTDEEHEVEVHIRQLEPQDEGMVLTLVYNGIYVLAMNRMLLNNMERPYIICIIGIFAIVANWLTGGIILALVISVLGVPLVVYVFMRYVILSRFKYEYLKDVTGGMYNYWTQPDTGRTMWVAECTGRVIGCVAIETVSPMVVELKRLSVGSEWQCMGVGGKLADYAMNQIKQCRFKEVVAHALAVSQEMTNLLNKLGFRNSGSRKVFFRLTTREDYLLKLPGRSSITEEERQNLNI